MKPLPTVFVSHGAPTYALEPGVAGPGLAALAQTLPRPAAVLVVSAHWITRQPLVGAVARPQTIHDFGGFDPALYDILYPADGHPGLAARAVECLRDAGWDASADPARGLDHGAWVPLMHMYPAADVPVFQVSMPSSLDADSAIAFGRALAPLANENVLILGSGSLTHNLREFRSRAQADSDYVAEFSGWISDAVAHGDLERLRQALEIAPHARRAHPTSDHFLPLLVAAGAAAQVAPATLLEGGVQYGMLSMDSFVFGQDLAVGTNKPARMKSLSGEAA